MWLMELWREIFLIEVTLFFHLQLEYDMKYSFKINSTRIEIKLIFINCELKSTLKLNQISSIKITNTRSGKRNQ